MDSGYVNYLNRPKRAKYNVDSDVVLQQIFQASIWNSCLSFQQSTEVKALSRKYISCPDKTNLRDEVKFDLKHTATTCSCIYRHQQCQKHASTSYSSCASNEAYNDYVANCHNLKADHLASRKRRHSLYNKVLGQKFKLRHHRRHYPYGQTNRGDNNFLNCSNRIGMHESSSSPNVFNSITLKGSASTNHVVEAEALCMCQSVPKPLVSCFYEKDSLSFFIRKSLALYLVLNFSLKTNRRDIDGKISISSKLKKLIKILCKITYAKPVSCKSCFNHINHISKSFEKNNFSYLYYDKNGIVTSLEKYLKHSFPLDDSLLSSSLQASQVLGNEKEVNGEQHDEDCTSNDTSLMINTLLSNYCSHSVCDSHCSYQKKFPSLLNANMSSSNKRISSRLQKKRDSGVRGPYSADYIVEVPVIKAKKPKSSHPYSHPLFWNFYNNLEKSESCRWRTLAMTYFKTSKPHIQNNHLNISDDFNFLDLPENQKFSKRPESMASCPFCKTCFDNLKPEERVHHVNRHQQSNWRPFEIPKFFLNKRLPKLRQVVDEEKQTKTDLSRTVLAEKPVKADHFANVLAEKPVRIESPKIVEKPIVKKTVVFSGIPNRPTARKSHGSW